MIFKPELVAQIQQGKKTQTRRRVKDGETSCRYQPGKVYALQAGRGLPGTGKITVVEVRQELLGDITEKDAVREGFRNVAAFRAYWVGLHRAWNPALRVWVVTFVKGDQLDRPRLLAARSGGPGGDYTTIPARAMREEGEAVPEETQEKFTREGQEMDRVRLALLRDQALGAIDEIMPHASGLQRKRLRAARNQIAQARVEERPAA